MIGNRNSCLTLTALCAVSPSVAFMIAPTQPFLSIFFSGGAAVIASTVSGLAQLKSPINIRAYLPLVENMPDGNAIRPGDVLKMANGCTVQVKQESC